MLQRFTQFIAEQHLFSTEQEVLLAVSGGRDSVAMTHLMHAAGYRFAIAHCNFHLRGSESDRDLQFVSQLAHSMGVPFYTVDFATLDYASAHGESIEEAARHLRYEWFSSICSQYGYACLATAHHLDDSVETFFLNLFRGTGIAGLHGIRPSTMVNGATVVRPMLCFSRAEIDEYLSRHRLAYVDDSTNAEMDVQRNRLRLRLMPLLHELYPRYLSTMQANIEHLSDAEQLYNAQIDTLRVSLVRPLTSSVPGVENAFFAVDMASLRHASPLGTVLYELLRPYGFSSSVVDDILSSGSHTGAYFTSPTHQATLHRDMLVLGARNNHTVEPQLEVSTSDVSEPLRLVSTATPRRILLDASEVHGTLHLRPWREGDRFCPFGMTHSRLVSDFLKDNHLHRLEKQAVRVLVDADDRIVWVVGLRSDNRFRLTENTRTVLTVTLK